MHLPEKFQKEMEILLGDEYQAFKERIDNEINQISARPSFTSKVINIFQGSLYPANLLT